MQRKRLFQHLFINMQKRFFSSLLFAIVLFFGAQPGFAQEADSLNESGDAVNTNSGVMLSTSTVDYSAIDARIATMKGHYKKIPQLAQELAAPYTTDEDKVRAIFMWTTSNIAYDCSLYHSKNRKGPSISYKSQAELDAKRDKYYMDYATRILRSHKAICEGYAVLFQELCKQNNIRCEIVIGCASNNTSKIERMRNRKNFGTNHAWDKVMLNGTWYYVDATWAAGYCDKDVKKFYKDFKPYYYLTPVDKLYSTHAANERQTEKRNNAVAKSR